jgi:hypothetical protein
VTVPARAARSRPGTPIIEPARNSRGSHISALISPHDHIDRLQAFDGLQVDAIVAHGEVRAFDDAEAEGS